MELDSKLFSKPGHKKRFLAGVQIEASKLKHGSENKIPNVFSSSRERNENVFKECAGNDISKCKYLSFPVLLIDYLVCVHLYDTRFAYGKKQLKSVLWVVMEHLWNFKSLQSEGWYLHIKKLVVYINSLFKTSVLIIN